MVLAGRLAGDAVNSPFGGPVDSPGQLALRSPDIRRAFDTVTVDPVNVRVLVSGDADPVNAAFGV